MMKTAPDVSRPLLRPVPLLRSLDSYDYRLICVLAACLIYALFGSPTPDRFGVVEGAVAVLFALGIGIGRAHDAFFEASRRRFWKSAGQVFLAYGLSVPFLVTALSHQDMSAALRDVIPFLFLFLPLFILPVIRARPQYYHAVVAAVLCIGLIFAARSLLMRSCGQDCGGALLYLENMPTVLFAALFLIGTAAARMCRRLSVKNSIMAFCFISLAAIPLAAMVVTLQRASVGSVVLYTLIVVAVLIYTRPRAIWTVLWIGVLGAVYVNISFDAVFDVLWEKTRQVGLNMRPQEARAVWNVLTADVVTFLFGIGWGGTFESPAVGGLRVNFTHNFFTSMMLKTGVIGCTLCAFYVVGLLERLARVVLAWPIMGLAIAFPVLIDITLYASFKSLDFGLVLLLISGTLVYVRHRAQTETDNHTVL